MTTGPHDFPADAVDEYESGQLALAVAGEQRSLLPLVDPPADDEESEQ